MKYRGDFMKKKLLAFIPLVISVVPLTSCDKYSYSDPHKMIKNMYGSDVHMAYPYAPKKESGLLYITDKGSTVVEEIKDIENVIVNGFKQVKTFNKVDSIDPSSDNYILFSFHHFVSENSVSLTYFSLYDDGNLYCNLYYYVKENGDYISKGKSLYFTFDAAIAKEIYNNAYAEFDRAKEEETSFVNNEITFDGFFKNLNENAGRASFIEDRTSLEDDGRIGEEFKKLSKKVDSNNIVTEFPIEDFGHMYIAYEIFDPKSEYKKYFTYNDMTLTIWRMELNEEGTYLHFEFDGCNKYFMHFRITRLYRINPSDGLETVNNIKAIVAEMNK